MEANKENYDVLESFDLPIDGNIALQPDDFSGVVKHMKNNGDPGTISKPKQGGGGDIPVELMKTVKNDTIPVPTYVPRDKPQSGKKEGNDVFISPENAQKMREGVEGAKAREATVPHQDQDTGVHNDTIPAGGPDIPISNTQSKALKAGVKSAREWNGSLDDSIQVVEEDIGVDSNSDQIEQNEHPSGMPPWLSEAYWNEDLMINGESVKRSDTEKIRHDYIGNLDSANRFFRGNSGYLTEWEISKGPKTIDGVENHNVPLAKESLSNVTQLKMVIEDIVKMNTLSDADTKRREKYKGKGFLIPDYNAFQFLTAASEYPELDRHKVKPSFKELLIELSQVRILDLVDDISVFFEDEHIQGGKVSVGSEKYNEEGVTLITYIEYLLEASDDETTKSQFNQYFDYLSKNEEGFGIKQD